MSNWSESLFGMELLTKDGVKPTIEVLSNKKYVGIYFSAHWCPPCRGFTPVLGEFYDSLKEEDGHEDTLEIIFASSDSDDSSFQEYYRSQPWTSVPFSKTEIIQALGSKFSVRGIPTLIILDGATGAVKDPDGRQTIASSKGDSKKALAVWA